MGDKRAIYFLEGYDANKQLVYFGMTLYQNMNWTTKNVADTDISKQKRDIPPAAFAQQWEGANQKTWLLKAYTPDASETIMHWFIASYLGTTPLPEWAAVGMATVKTSAGLLTATVYRSDDGEQFKSTDGKISYRRKYIATADPRPAAQFPKPPKVNSKL